MNQAPLLVLACGPRAGGNTDRMARSFAEGAQAAGEEVNLIFLRDFAVRPCVGCQTCLTNQGHACPLAPNDDVEKLFQLIREAKRLFISSPVYFYALPAYLKGFIDRGQRLWAQNNANPGSATPASIKPAAIGLIAGNKKGEKLFEGSLLTLRYFLQLFDIEIIDTILLRGYDAKNSLASDPAMLAQILERGNDSASCFLRPCAD